jgi:hypothetical protein
MRNWKVCGRKRPWPNFKELPWNSPGETDEHHKTDQDSPSSGLDFNSGAPEYEVDLLNTRPLRSMSHTVLVTSNWSQVMDDSNIKCESNRLHDV